MSFFSSFKMREWKYPLMICFYNVFGNTTSSLQKCEVSHKVKTKIYTTVRPVTTRRQHSAYFVLMGKLVFCAYTGSIQLSTILIIKSVRVILTGCGEAIFTREPWTGGSGGCPSPAGSAGDSPSLHLYFLQNKSTCGHNSSY